MRVIAGIARRLKLESPEGLDVRPTTDRVKETLFNILQNDIYGCRFLDLFSGSGAIGIEALSRGASKVALVDSSRISIKSIENNLRVTKLDNATVLHMDYMSALKRLYSWGEKFDIIFIDPPYKTDFAKEALKEISRIGILAERGIIIVEADLKTELSKLDGLGFEIFRKKKYKTNQHFFIREKEDLCI